MDSSVYHIESIEDIYSPGLIVFRDLVEQNISEMIRIAEGAQRLRPHCKTHKLAEVTQLQMKAGIEKFKCATIAEAEMLARTGVKDIFLAYNPVGPNIHRVVELKRAFEDLDLSVTVDHPQPLELLGNAAVNANIRIGAVLDLDTGMQRTGIPPGEQANELYEMICTTPGIVPSGLHWYDGQHHQADYFERQSAVEHDWQRCLKFKDQLLASGFSVPRVVAGGTGSFPIHAEHGEPSLELSPGTVVFHDAGYSAMFPDLKFTPAALLLTRVVSNQSSGKLTFDAGTKAVAADPAQSTRLVFPELPDARILIHNEEHLVVETESADRFQPGDTLLAIPWHVCPTTALHQSVHVVVGGQISDQWIVASRNRKLTF